VLQLIHNTVPHAKNIPSNPSFGKSLQYVHSLFPASNHSHTNSQHMFFAGQIIAASHDVAPQGTPCSMVRPQHKQREALDRAGAVHEINLRHRRLTTILISHAISRRPLLPRSPESFCCNGNSPQSLSLRRSAAIRALLTPSHGPSDAALRRTTSFTSRRLGPQEPRAQLRRARRIRYHCLCPLSRRLRDRTRCVRHSFNFHA
jgi:hypothetical protein